MFSASELKKGAVVKIDGDPHMVESVSVNKPSARGAVTLYKIRFRNLVTKRKTDQSLRGDDMFDEAADQYVELAQAAPPGPYPDALATDLVVRRSLTRRR